MYERSQYHRALGGSVHVDSGKVEECRCNAIQGNVAQLYLGYSVTTYNSSTCQHLHIIVSVLEDDQRGLLGKLYEAAAFVLNII